MDDAISQGRFTVVDVGDDGKVSDVLHVIYLFAGNPVFLQAPEHKCGGGILTKPPQNLTHFRHIQEVVADLLPGQAQHRNVFAIQIQPFRAGINIHHHDRKTMLAAQILKYSEHVVAKMAAGPAIQGEDRLIYRLNL